ncbi:hypothetical protein HXX76_009503 [Chlamydomonas incerta]|uniref:GIY-YIG domain-containing protein n=1 Tax=Chlamydomonas incerta TaxID=51695 RepID=A0A835VZK5_CHLIN|nr:hypothetical protein HXX76_009503 [Chlamydomonas incerta]|eukprot:KAG2431489.1 hypothetical protein HXX76_009503 [Chlamydomonas incerta]
MQRSARQLLGPQCGQALVAALSTGAGVTGRRASSTTARPYFNYILVSESTQRTYNGITNDLARRLRQHRGEAPGGAKSTRTAKDWTYLAVVGCPDWGPTAARGPGGDSPGGGSAGGGHGAEDGCGGGGGGGGCSGGRKKAASGAAAAASFEARLRYPTGTRPRPARFAGPQGRLRGLCLVLQARAEEATSQAAAPAAAAAAAAQPQAAAAARSAPAPAPAEPSTPNQQQPGGAGDAAPPGAARKRRRSAAAAAAGSSPSAPAAVAAAEALRAPPPAHVPMGDQPAAAGAQAVGGTGGTGGTGGSTCSGRPATPPTMPTAWVWVHPSYRDCGAVVGCPQLQAAMAAADALRRLSYSHGGSGGGSKQERGGGRGAAGAGRTVDREMEAALAVAALDALVDKTAAAAVVGDRL